MQIIKLFIYMLRTNQTFALCCVFLLLFVIYITDFLSKGVFFSPLEMIDYFYKTDVAIKSSIISGGITFLSLLLTLYFGRREWERQIKIKEKINIYDKVSDHVYLIVSKNNSLRKEISDFKISVITDCDYEECNSHVLELNASLFEIAEMVSDAKFIENKNVYEMVDSIYSKGDFKQISKIIEGSFISLTAKLTDIIIRTQDNKEDINSMKDFIYHALNEMEDVLEENDILVHEALLKYAELMKNDLYPIKGIIGFFRGKNA